MFLGSLHQGGVTQSLLLFTQTQTAVPQTALVTRVCVCISTPLSHSHSVVDQGVTRDVFGPR